MYLWNDNINLYVLNKNCIININKIGLKLKYNLFIHCLKTIKLLRFV